MNDTKGLELLNKICPQFSADRLTCCSPKQLATLDSNLNTLRQFASRCPACLQNLINVFCESTCSPDQSLFMEPKDLFFDQKSILSIDYFASSTFKKGVFNSCKDVVFPENNEKILNLLCGTSAEKCTPQKLLEYMGSTSNGISSFDIVFPEILPKGLAWMNVSTYTSNCSNTFVNPWANFTLPPFYRLEKLIITANPNYPQKQTGYKQAPYEKWVPFGHIFHLDLLNQV